MAEKLVTTNDLMSAYRVNSAITIRRWMKRENDPLPPPVSGSKGRGNAAKWRRSDLTAWEIKVFGAEISM